MGEEYQRSLVENPLAPGFSLRLVTKSGIRVHYVLVFLFMCDGDLLLFQDSLLFYWDNRGEEDEGDRKGNTETYYMEWYSLLRGGILRFFSWAGRGGGRGSGVQPRADGAAEKERAGRNGEGSRRLFPESGRRGGWSG